MSLTILLSEEVDLLAYCGNMHWIMIVEPCGRCDRHHIETANSICCMSIVTRSTHCPPTSTTAHVSAKNTSLTLGQSASRPKAISIPSISSIAASGSTSVSKNAPFRIVRDFGTLDVVMEPTDAVERTSVLSTKLRVGGNELTIFVRPSLTLLVTAFMQLR